MNKKILITIISTIFLSLCINSHSYAASLNKTMITLEEGGTYNLKVLESSSKTTWKSSNTSIAIVSDNGLVTAKSSGEALITATIGKESFSCIVKVMDSENAVLSGSEIYTKCMGAIVSITYNGGGGSGFFIESNKILTNYHVVKDAENMTIVDINNKSYTVKSILGYNEDLDLALLETNQTSAIYLKRNTHKLIPGETVYTLGCPFGIPFVIAQGLLGKTQWDIEGKNTIMHTAPMSSGNSGGPLVNGYGEVIGINTLSSGGESAQLLNYAVKIEEMDKLDFNKSVSMEEFANRNNLPVVITSSAKAKVGDYIVLGEYEQDNNKSNGKEDIEWLVLSATKDKLLVVSRYCLDITCWNSNNEFVTWKNSEHRDWLNNTFYKDAFNANEKKKILYANTSEDVTEGFTEAGKSGTYDHVFLMSLPEVDKYFVDELDKRAIASDYCKSLGAGEFGNSYTFWSTRSASNDEQGKYLTVAVFGDITSDNSDGTSIVGRMATRPAMWINR